MRFAFIISLAAGNLQRRNFLQQSLLTISKSLRGSYDGDSQENFFNWNAKSTYNHRSSSRFLHKSCENGLSEMGVSADGSLERRLSPKVFGNMSDVLPVSQSMEDLKTQSKLYEDLEPVDSFMKKHSLQDLTVFTAESETQVIEYSFLFLFFNRRNRQSSRLNVSLWYC